MVRCWKLNHGRYPPASPARIAPARQSRRNAPMNSRTKVAIAAPHHSVGVPIEVIALLHRSTMQPSWPFLGLWEKEEVGLPWISHDQGLVLYGWSEVTLTWKEYISWWYCQSDRRESGTHAKVVAWWVTAHCRS